MQFQCTVTLNLCLAIKVNLREGEDIKTSEIFVYRDEFLSYSLMKYYYLLSFNSFMLI